MSAQNRLQDVLTGKQGNYILPFFWQHGEEEAVLREYMQVIHNANIGAVCVESRPHPDFGGDGWWRDMDIILDEAGKLDMKVWILDDSHFPTGFANGAVLKAPKELHHRYLAVNTVELAGPRPQVEVRIDDMIHPPVLPPWIPTPPNAPAPIGDDSLFGIYACRIMDDATLGEPVELTAQVRDGLLTWDLPEGYWRIFFAYLTYDGRARDDYINFLDMDSCHLLIDAVYEPHFAHYQDLFGSVIAGFFSDEPPVGNTPGYSPAQKVGTDPAATLAWSAALPERVSGSFGSSDWTKYIPYLFAPAHDEDTHAKVCTAYMDAVSRLVQECFSQQLGQWCEKHGVEYIGHQLEDVDFNSHLGPSMGHFFRGLDGQHMAGIDNIGLSLEIGAQNTGRRSPYSLHEPTFYHYTLGKLAASHASIDEKKQGRAMCENFGAYGWQTGTRSMKYLLDELLVRGVNHYVPHAFTPKAFPDFDCPPHFYAHGENPEYEAFGDLMLYANRMCHLINGGTSRPSVAILYHAEADWAGFYESNGPVAKALSQDQLDYHIIPADVFSEKEKYHTVLENGKLTVNGTSYSALVMSGSAYISSTAAQFVCEAAKAGFPVAVAGMKSHAVADPAGLNGAVASGTAAESISACCKAVMAAVNALPAMEISEIPAWVRSLGIGDVTACSKTPWMTVYHYNNGKDLYLILNEDPAHAYTDDILVSAKGAPALYDAWNNRILDVPFRETEKGTLIRMDLAPLEMAVIVFDAADAAFNDMDQPLLPVTDFTAAAAGQVLTGFKVSKTDAKSYLAGHGADACFDEVGMFGEDGTLESLAGLLPDFSGWLRYETAFEASVPATGSNKDASETGRAVLVIDDCYEYAKVYVNGQLAGTATAAPYRFEVGALLREGRNELRIDVANTLERKVRSMGVDVSSMHVKHPYSPVGIIGKVSLLM